MSELSQTVTSQINKIQEDCAKIEPLVCIRCITFNHEPYIRDALEGFVMQKTDFPFVAIVHDDASTDKTADIIREYADKYPEIIKPIFEKENQYSKPGSPLEKIMQEAIEATGAKYVAMCEGDDYWTDPFKLQKQVDFLESHPDYSMCYSKVRRYDHINAKFLDIWGGPDELFNDLLMGNKIPTLTTLLRTNLIRSYSIDIEPSTHKWLMGDYPLWLYVAALSKVKFIPEITGVYRILKHSASHSTNLSKQIKFIINYREIALFFANRFDVDLEKNIKNDINFWVYANTISMGNNISVKDKIKALITEGKLKRKILILLSIISNKIFKSILSNKL